MKRIKSRIGHWVPWLRPYYVEARLMAYAVRNGLWRSIGRKRARVFEQAVRFWPATLPTFEDSESAIEYFRSAGLEVREGSNTFYLPPQPGLQDVLGVACNQYPPSSGFKFLKNLGAEEADSYLPPSKQTVLRRRLLGRPQGQMVVANYMNELRLGPRAWDYCVFRTEHLALSAFVVEHVEGRRPTHEEYAGFMHRMNAALSRTELRITVANWERKGDFRGPDCNGNLVTTGNGDVWYVDFQNFGIRSIERYLDSILDDATAKLHFGNQRVYRREPFLYQSIPGLRRASKRDTEGRFETILKLFQDQGICIRDRLVLDVGCNAGIMLQHALAAGASWGVGWDRPAVAEQAERLSRALGFTRLTSIPADLHEDYDFVATMPEWLRPQLNGSIVLFLAIRGHIGIPASITSIPWECLVYEGHQGESLEEAGRHVQPLLVEGREITSQLYLRDGNSRPRPLLVLRGSPSLYESDKITSLSAAGF